MGDLDLLHHLRVAVPVAAEPAERLAHVEHRGQGLQRGQHPVAGRGEFAKNYMAAGLSAQLQVSLLHGVGGVLVSHRHVDDAYPQPLQVFEEAVVGHESEGNPVVGKAAALLEVRRDHRDYIVAVQLYAFFVGEHAAVGVPVEADAAESSPLRGFFRHLLGVQRAAAHVDVLPVRLISDHLYFSAQVAEDARGDFIGGAVGAVQEYLEAFKAEAGREGALEESFVIQREIFFMQAGMGGPEGEGLFTEQQLLDLLFYLLAEFQPVAGEELYPVEFGRVMAGRDDYAEVGVLALHQVGDRVGGDYAEVQHFELACAEALHEVFFYQFTGSAGVHAHQHHRL